MHRDDSKEPWGLASFEPPPFEETRLLGLTEQSLPVRPLRSPLERALILAILAVGLGALVLLATSLRADLGKVPWAVAYGPALLELLAGAGVYWLAMRWSVPGSGERYSRSSVLLATAWAWLWPRPWRPPISLPGTIPASAWEAPLKWACRARVGSS